MELEFDFGDSDLDTLDMGDVGGIDMDIAAMDFDLSLPDTADLSTRYIKPAYHRPVAQACVKEERASDLAAKITMERGMRFHAVVSGNFIFSQFIAALLIDKGIKAKRIIISTLSMSQDCVEALKDICDLGFCDKLDLIISSYFYSHERRLLVPYIYEALDYDDAPFDFQLAVAGTHCKTVLIETEGGAKLVIHGSANLRSSRSLEQFTLEENPELFDFHLEYSEAILDNYKTINKEIRANKLWSVINGKQIDSRGRGIQGRKQSKKGNGKG